MNYITLIMLVFSMIAAIDRIIGGKMGLAKEFERGFMLLGVMMLSMTGMISISPIIADLLEPLFDLIYNALHIDPSIIPASIFALKKENGLNQKKFQIFLVLLMVLDGVLHNKDAVN